MVQTESEKAYLVCIQYALNLPNDMYVRLTTHYIIQYHDSVGSNATYTLPTIIKWLKRKEIIISMLCSHENKCVVFEFQVETYFELSSFDVTPLLLQVVFLVAGVYDFDKQNVTYSMI